MFSCKGDDDDDSQNTELTANSLIVDLNGEEWKSSSIELVYTDLNSATDLFGIIAEMTNGDTFEKFEIRINLGENFEPMEQVYEYNYQECVASTEANPNACAHLFYGIGQVGNLLLDDGYISARENGNSTIVVSTFSNVSGEESMGTFEGTLLHTNTGEIIEATNGRFRVTK